MRLFQTLSRYTPQPKEPAIYQDCELDPLLLVLLMKAERLVLAQRALKVWCMREFQCEMHLQAHFLY